MKHAFYLSEKVVDERKFYYIDFGSEVHGRTSFRLWVHSSLVERDDKGKPVLYLPRMFARIDQGKHSKTKILRPDKSFWIAHFYCRCGYRGGSSLTVKEKDAIVIPYSEYRSPRGACGISIGALIQIPIQIDAITIKWKRWGRLYGAPGEGTVILTKTGLIEELPEADLCEIEDLAER